MAKKKSLKGMRVLVTRPEHQAEALCELISKAGGKPSQLPLLNIVPPDDVKKAQNTLSHADAYDWAIFTSVNAVKEAIRMVPDQKWPKNIACLGSGSSRALEAAGIHATLVPDSGSTSEDLLASAALEDVNGQTILLVKGMGGRELLSPTLTARGARVDTVDVYQRVPAELDAQALDDSIADIDVLVITSGESLEHLASYASSPRSSLFSVQLVVPSRRVVTMAEELGFICEPLVPEKISDQGILDALLEWAA